MERISSSSLTGEIKEELRGFNFSSVPSELLHEYVKHKVIPLIQQRACTVAAVIDAGTETAELPGRR